MLYKFLAITLPPLANKKNNSPQPAFKNIHNQPNPQELLDQELENFTPPTEIIALVGGGGGGGGGHGSQGALKNSRTGNPDNDDDDQPEEDSRGSCVYSSDLYESSGIPLPTNSCCEDDEDCQFAAGKDVNGTCNEANECVPLDSPIYDSPGINCEFEDPGCVYDPSDDFNSCNVTVIKCTAACNLDMPCNDGACCVERLSNSSRQCGSGSSYCYYSQTRGQEQAPAFVPGASCDDPNFCLPSGGCCNNDVCTIETGAECAELGGTYLGDDLGCPPPEVPCLSSLP